jgi:uncharacterized membrane protein YccF (DUF307 family)
MDHRRQNCFVACWLYLLQFVLMVSPGIAEKTESRESENSCDSCMGLCLKGFWFLVSGFWFQVSGFWFLGIWFLGFGSWDLDLLP